MASFIIEGGHLLKGTITPQGAKNEALQVICATLLTDEEVIIRNIPDIRDVNNLIQLLRDIGVKVKKKENTFSFQADELKLDYLESDEFVKKCAQLRGSVLMIGPLLARMGKAVITKPNFRPSRGVSPSLPAIAMPHFGRGSRIPTAHPTTYEIAQLRSAETR